MTRRKGVFFLIFLFGLLFGLNKFVTGNWVPPSGDSGIWFSGGLFMIIVGAYWTENFFTKPADVAQNAIVAIISISMLSSPPLKEWWDGLQIFSAIIGVIAIALAFQRANPTGEVSTISRLGYEIVSRVGASSVLFSLVFVLSLISYFDFKSPETKAMVIFWGLVLFFKHARIDEIIDVFIKKITTKNANTIGKVTRLFEPGIVRFQLFPGAVCKSGDVIALTNGKLDAAGGSLAVVVEGRHSPRLLEMEALLLESADPSRLVSEYSFVVLPELDEATRTKVINLKRSLIGVAAKGTNIGRLNFEIIDNESTLQQGLLISAQDRHSEVMFQMVDGTLNEEASIEGGERSFTVAQAEQLGVWNIQRGGFETFSWVVSENAPIRVRSDQAIPEVAGAFKVGQVPGSMYPVNISIQDLVMYHSAILGVTGSGKSFLAYSLIEACRESGIKVICLDVTGDYKRWIPNAVRLANPGHVRPFLDRNDGQVAIVEFHAQQTVTQSTLVLMRHAQKWCEENRSPEEIRVPIAKVLIVIEEAHTIVPERNSNPQSASQNDVIAISQIVLQSRKFGLGFMIVTQRTANVTKSILNQCNTIFAFQAFDETGFDFLRNYMGEHYVRALPTLKKREGVLVGKASRNERPIIARFTEQNRVTVEGIQDFAAPVAEVGAVVAKDACDTQ